MRALLFTTLAALVALVVLGACGGAGGRGGGQGIGGPPPGESRAEGGRGGAGARAGAAGVSDAEVAAAVSRLRAAAKAEAGGAALGASELAALLGAADALPGDALAELFAELPPGTSAAAAVGLRLALYRRHLGDRAGAQAALAALARLPAGSPLAARAAALRREIDAAADPAVVAVLLPLSGTHARLGAELRAAIELAAGDPAAEGAALRFLDTGGTPAGAERAVERAALRERAIAILGPVGDAESKVAARRAVELGVPIALLSPDDGGASPGAGVFRFWPSTEWEAREAARVAVERGFDALAVFAPRDELGEVAAGAFAAAARALGAEVVVVEYYDPTGSDLEPDVKRLLGLEPRTNQRLRRHLAQRGRKEGWKSFSPDVPFDLLYVPDLYQRGALVASYLPYFNVELRHGDLVDTLGLQKKHGGRLPSVVQLLGSSGWHHPGLIPRGGEAVEGALVLELFSATDGEEATGEIAVEFAERFEAARHRPPQGVSAQAYDAAVLLLSARARAAAGDAAEARARMAAALRGARLEDGACGPSMIDARGQLIREALVLRVELGGFVLEE